MGMGTKRLLTAAILLGAVATIEVGAATLNLATTPLYVTAMAKPNNLVILDNSNSMDEDASGSAVGSAVPTSKSEIARSVIKDLISSYNGQIALGLMTYQQSNVSAMFLHNSPYDASFDPVNYDPTFSGPRDSTTKRFRVPNASNPGSYVYYNVALPFYSSNIYDHAYCYSATAHAFNNGEDPVNGPWDNYDCYHTMTLAADNPAGLQNFSFGSSFFPTDSDLAQGIVDFGTFLTWDYVGPTWFSGSSPGRGYVHVPIGELSNPAQMAALNTKLGTSQFTTNGPTNPTLPLENAGNTPIEGTLLTARDYFSGALANPAEGGPLAAPPVSCGKDYVVLVTDGLPSTDQNGNVIADPVQALKDAATAAATLAATGVKTYVVGFALPYGIDPTTLDQLASAGGTVQALSASDASSLSAALNAIFSSIMANASSAASIALDSGSISVNNHLYQGRFTHFTASDWSGQLLSLPIAANGSVGGSEWDAANLLGGVASNNRVIATFNPSTGNAVPFRWGSLDATQQAALNTSPATGVADGQGAARLDYVRGDATDEGAGNNYRARDSRLGDIVHSTPVYVGEPKAFYSDALEAAPYSAFRQAHSGRTKMVYVGANDGMLHAFDATTGQERFAYVPSAVIDHLNRLTSPTYVHHYYVDGSPTVADAYFGGAWHTVLAGGLRAGGQAAYAVDVTDPAALGSEAALATHVLWEFSDQNDADMGYSFSMPVIARMHSGQWVAIFGNGYNNTKADGAASATGDAVLYIVDIATGALVNKIDTGAGMAVDPDGLNRPNGLATPAVADVDSDGVADYAYAGDLFGNLWKFDLTGANSGSWDVAYYLGATAVPLYRARAADGSAQPITTRPQVGAHGPGQTGGVMVYIGTGKYAEVGDNVAAGQTTQTFYGLWDQNDGTTPSFTRAGLVQQEILHELASGGGDVRVTSQYPVDWTTQYGWYLDLYNTEGGNTDNFGERQVSNSMLRNGRIIFTTLIPSADPCAYGGTGWLMEMDAYGGGRLGRPPFDLNDDGDFTDSDKVTTTDENGNSTPLTVSGKKSTVGIISTPGVMADPTTNTEYKYTSGSTGIIERTTENPGARLQGRQSWRQLQ